MTFEDLYTEHAGRIRRLAFSFLGDEFKAEDVCQEVFIRAIQQLPPRDWGDAWPWLRIVTKNLCIDLIRGKREFPSEEREISTDELTPEELYLRFAKQELVRTALGQLPRKHRKVLQLFYGHELSHRDIAAETGSTEYSVNNRLHYAKHLLRVELRKLGLPGVVGWTIMHLRRFRSSAYAMSALACFVIFSTVPGTFTPPSIGNPDIGSGPPADSSSREKESNQTRGPVLASLHPPPLADERMSSGRSSQLTPQVAADSPLPSEDPNRQKVRLGPIALSCNTDSGPLASELCRRLP